MTDMTTRLTFGAAVSFEVPTVGWVVGAPAHAAARTRAIRTPKIPRGRSNIRRAAIRSSLRLPSRSHWTRALARCPRSVVPLASDGDLFRVRLVNDRGAKRREENVHNDARAQL